MCSNFLNIAQIKLNTIPNDSKLHAELKNHNPEPRENDFWERSKFTWLWYLELVHRKERKYSHYLEVQYIVGFLMDSLRVSSPECRAMSAIEGHLEHFLLWTQWHHNRKCSRWCWRALIALHSGDETLSESIKKLTIYWTSTLTAGFPWTNSGIRKVEKWKSLRYRNIQFK